MVVALGGALLLFSRAGIAFNLESRFAIPGLSLIVLGGIFLVMTVAARPVLIEKATVSDAGIELRLTNGKAASIRWAEPELMIYLVEAARDRRGQPRNFPWRRINWKGFRNHVPIAVANAIVARAKRLGLSVSAETHGPFEVTTLAPRRP